MNRRDEILIKQAELKAELARLEAQEAAFNQLPLDQRVAELLHTLYCHSLHTDGCGWEYGSWNQPTHAHERYLVRAHRVINRVRNYLTTPDDQPSTEDRIYHIIEIAQDPQ